MGRPAHPARLAAVADGRATYSTGKACNLGGVAERLVTGNKCQCDAHKAKRAGNAKRRYLRDRPERLEKAKAWAAENREAKRKSAREWAARNSHSVKANTHKRRARKLNATPPWFGELDEFVVQEAHSLAVLRAEATGTKWEVDHVVPLAGRMVCGLHVAANIQVIPMAENRRKSNQHAVH